MYVGLDIGSTHLGLAYEAETRAGPGGQRISLWVYADDCDAAVDRLRDSGVHMLEEPTDQPWGERVARVRDPDGNEVLVGS